MNNVELNDYLKNAIIDAESLLNENKGSYAAVNKALRGSFCGDSPIVDARHYIRSSSYDADDINDRNLRETVEKIDGILKRLDVKFGSRSTPKWGIAHAVAVLGASWYYKPALSALSVSSAACGGAVILSAALLIHVIRSR